MPTERNTPFRTRSLLEQQLEAALGRMDEMRLDLDEVSTELDRARLAKARLRKLLRAERSANLQLRQQLESLEQLQQQLPTTIGHEFRTPISIIQGWSEYLLDQPPGVPDTAEHLTEILRSSRELSRKVDRSILLAQALSGQLCIDPQPLELGEAVDRALGAEAEQIQHMNLVVDQRLPIRPPLVLFDGICLDAVLQALIENAVKFNRPGGLIKLRVHRHRSNVSLAIRNTGAGIPSDRLDRVFLLFGQVDHGSTRRYGGLGLGLPLAKNLLERSGATIRAASRGPDHGATFTILLPTVS